MSSLQVSIKKGVDNQFEQIKRLFRQPILLLIIIIVFSFFFLFGVYPIYKVLKVAIIGKEGFSLSYFWGLLSSKFFLTTLWNSIRLGLLSASFATIIGFVFAFAITRTEMKGKKFFHLIALMPIISPPFVIALSMILLFGRNGAITNGIFGLTNTNIYGLGSLVFIQTLAFFPIAYLSLKGVLESIDPALEDAALNMGASRWKVFKTITFPLAIPGIFSALLLVFIKSIEILEINDNSWEL